MTEHAHVLPRQQRRPPLSTRNANGVRVCSCGPLGLFEQDIDALVGGVNRPKA